MTVLVTDKKSKRSNSMNVKILEKKKNIGDERKSRKNTKNTNMSQKISK